MVVYGPYPSGEVPLWLWAGAFAATFVIEALVMAMFFRGLSRKQLMGVLAANLLTHPATVYLWIPFASGTLQLSVREILLTAEGTIPLIEAAVYVGFGFRSVKKTVLAAVVSNFVSWMVLAWLQ